MLKRSPDKCQRRWISTAHILQGQKATKVAWISSPMRVILMPKTIPLKFVATKINSGVGLNPTAVAGQFGHSLIKV